MRTLNRSLTSALLVLSAAAALAACTADDDGPTLPDAAFGFDGGPGRDGAMGIDGDIPDPTVDTCTAESMDSTLGEACSTDEECSDGCFCNGSEGCSGGTCVAGETPCDDGIDCTADACLEEVDRCFYDPQHEMCGDGDECNGRELCDLVMGCRPASPLYCNDENSCTVDSCDTEMGCVYVERDLDGDGYVDGRCGGEDCDDDPRFGADIYPGATEDCRNRRDDNCDGFRDFHDSTCVPTNDSCASAELLPGPGTYTGSTVGLTTTASPGCSTGSGPTAVFRINVADVSDVTVALGGGGSNAAISLRPWDDCSTGPDLACRQASFSVPASARARSAPAGDYAIIVQTTTASSFDVTVSIDPPTPVPPGETCGTAIDVTASAGTFPLAMAEDDGGNSCGPSFGTPRDAYFYFDLTETRDVTVTTTGPSTIYTSVGSVCGSATDELDCRSSFRTVTQFWRSLPAGRYFITVETTSTSGDITASVMTAPPTPIPANDRCPGATLTDGTSRSDTTIGFADDARGGSCAGTGYPDAFYTFTLASDALVVISVSNMGGSTSTRYYLTLRSTCGGTSTSSLSCISGTGTATINQMLTAGTYYLMVETTSFDPSDYRISFATF